LWAAVFVHNTENYLCTGPMCLCTFDTPERLCMPGGEVGNVDDGDHRDAPMVGSQFTYGAYMYARAGTYLRPGLGIFFT